MATDNHTKSKKAYLVSLKHKLKKHLQLQSASANQVDRRWLNGFMAAGFHSGLISLSELKLEYMKAHRNAYGERMNLPYLNFGLKFFIRWLSPNCRFVAIEQY